MSKESRFTAPHAASTAILAYRERMNSIVPDLNDILCKIRRLAQREFMSTVVEGVDMPDGGPECLRHLGYSVTKHWFRNRWTIRWDHTDDKWC